MKSVNSLSLTPFAIRAAGAGLMAIASLSVASFAFAQQSLSVDFTSTFQEIDGFGASDAWSINPTINKWVGEGKEADVEHLADLLFSTEQGIGLSVWRFNVGAGSYEQGTASNIPDVYRRAELFIATPGGAVDPSKQAGQVRFLQEAKERGVTNFVAFANSPPTWATKNGLAHPGTGGAAIGSTNLKADQVDNFARFLVDVVSYLRSSAGVPVNYISPINEPTWEWEGQSQEANRYNNDDMKAVYRSLNTALTDASLQNDVEVDGSEGVEYTAMLSDAFKTAFDGSVYTGGMNSSGYGVFKNYIDAFLGDSEMRGILGNKISAHGYWSDAWEDRMGTLRESVRDNLAAASPGAKIWMSEYCILGGATALRNFDGNGFNPADMNYALHVARVIHRDLSRMNASSWQWWLGLTPYNYKDGLIKINSSLDASSVQDSKLMWTLGNFSRFIRPGFVRVDLPLVDDLYGVMASAYKKPDDSQLVIVAINESNSAADITLNVANLPVATPYISFDVYQTDATHNLVKVGTATSSYQLPAKSVVTFVGVPSATESSSSSSESSSSSSSSSSEETSVASSSSSSSVSKNSSGGGSVNGWLLALCFVGLFNFGAVRRN